MGLFRLALAWSVLLGHSGGHGFFGLAFLDRQLAVQSFFIISGFYMALVLNEKYLGPGRYQVFVQQRFLRLYPTYFILLVFILAIDGAVSVIGHAPYASIEHWGKEGHVLTPASIALLVAANLLVLGQDVVSLLDVNTLTGQMAFFHQGENGLSAHWFFLNRPSWSLSVEFFFYLLAPLLVCRTVVFQAGMLLASLALRMWLGHTLGHAEGDAWTYTFFPPNLCFFLAGSLGYVFYMNFRPRLEAGLPKHRWTFYVFAVFIAAYNRLPFAHDLAVVLIPLVCLMVPVLFCATRKNRIDRLIGELSYPFYLIHEHVLIYMKSVFVSLFRSPEDHLPVLYAPCCAFTTLLLAWLFYRLIETRTERYRENLFRRFRDQPSALDPDKLRATA
jgi:peptidoglycan/LPS O-acetylase OafA/YrhL